jgi:LPXTG-motif cell wall-anchored protein
MTIWRGRRCRAAVPLALRAGALGLLAIVALAVPATAGTDDGGASDPRDIGTRLDLKTLTHAQDGASIVYTAETYAPFSDQSAAFKWGVDRDRDEAFDLIVVAEWRDGKLIGAVKEPGGHQVAPASVSRPGPTVIRVSFPAAVFGDASVYRYAVDAEGASGERDLAPNSGLVQHRLGGAAASTKEVRTAGSSPAAPTPAPVRQAASAAPAPAPVAAAPAKTGLPRTGPGDGALLSWSGLALMTGGAFVALGARRSRALRRESTGGIR